MPLRKRKSRSILDVPERERGRPGLEQVAKLLRDADPKEHRRAKDAGEWDEYVETTRNLIIKYANNLMDTGELPSQAWRRSIVMYVHGKEWD